MELAEIANRVALIKEKTIDKIDYHFKEYLMVDTVGQKASESVIDEMDWYGYWKEVAMDIKFVIDDLSEYTGLVYSKDGLTYDKDSKVNSLLKEVIGYKMICDKNLQANEHFSFKNVQDEVFGIKDEISFNDSFPPLLIVNEKNEDEIIQIIYTYLVKNEIVADSGLENFKLLFKKESKPIPIKWGKDAIMFVAFFELMIDKNIIKLPHDFKDKTWEYLTRIFLDQNGNSFSTKLLGNRKTQKNYDKKKKAFKNKLIPLLSPYIEDANTIAD
jgi:hypothetical protein